ncbi:hypothetical protein [Kitasatospora aureofaciens]
MRTRTPRRVPLVADLIRAGPAAGRQPEDKGAALYAESEGGP